MTMKKPWLLLLLACLLILSCHSFVTVPRNSVRIHLEASAIDSEPLPLNEDDLQDIKSELVRICKASPKPGLDMIRSLTQQVEGVGEQVRSVRLESCMKQMLLLSYHFTITGHPGTQMGIGQSSSSSGLLSGEW